MRTTIKTKISLVVFFIFLALALALAVIGGRAYHKHKELKVAECRSQVLFQAERLEDAVRRLRDNVRLLALDGELLFKSNTAVGTPGRHAVMRNFMINTLAVGGGIWFAPHIVEPQRELLCYYAYTLAGAVVFDESFESREYYYPRQEWYLSIKEQLEQSGGRLGLDVAWTAPYFDDTGTMALMTTAGSGMYDHSGVFIGMATVDWQLDDIAAHMATVRPTPDSFALFADARHDYILALSEKGLPQNPVGKSLSTVSWYKKDAPEERLITHKGESWLSFTKPFGNGMMMAINVPERELFVDIHRALKLSVAALLFATLLIVGITWLLLNRLIERPVAALAGAADEIGKGNLEARVELAANDEFGVLASAFNHMSGDLKSHIEHLKTVTAEKERFATELSIAHDIQASLLPSIFPPFPNRLEMDIHAVMIPAKAVGGDFYDFFFIDENHLAVVVADVSDKGVPAALFMVVAKTLLRNNAQEQTGVGEVLAKTNAQLYENNKTFMFVTAALGILDLESGLFTYANAGHNPLLVHRSEGEFEPLPMPKGLPLAVRGNSVYPTAEVVLKSGDALFLYTDGVTEAANLTGEFFGEAGLEQSLNTHYSTLQRNLADLLNAVKTDIDIFAGGAMQSDDITMLALVYKGK